MLQAVLFDLDDTLVIADNDALWQDYITRLAKRFSASIEPQRFQQQLVHSTMYAIKAHPCDSPFLARFNQHFFTNLGIDADITPFLDFYGGEYNELGCWAHPAPGARAAIDAARALGLRVALATNPVFPRQAIETRLAWADLSDIVWDLVTVGEEMHYCKPHPQYFYETAHKLGVPSEACLMVGNDPENDLPAALAGMQTFLVRVAKPGTKDAMKAFSGPGAGKPIASQQPDYQGTLLDLPHVLRQLVYQVSS